MKSIAIALFAFVAVAAAQAPPPAGAAPAGDDAHAETLRSESVVNPDSFQYNYETSNGIKAQAAGQLKEISKEESGVVHQGEFAYTAPDGTPIHVTYVADENGYQPQGDHLPVAPAIPDAIARSLEYIAAHPPAADPAAPQQ